MNEKKGKFGNSTIRYFISVQIFCSKILILGIFSVLVLAEWIK